jgi:hypothetical protein
MATCAVTGGNRYNMVTGRYDRTDYPSVMELFKAVDQDAIVEAINTSNFDLAMANWNKWVRPWIVENFPLTTYSTGATHPLPANIEALDHLIEVGIDHYWPGRGHEVFERICNFGAGHGSGWEAFALSIVKKEQKGAVA